MFIKISICCKHRLKLFNSIRLYVQNAGFSETTQRSFLPNDFLSKWLDSLYAIMLMMWKVKRLSVQFILLDQSFSQSQGIHQTSVADRRNKGFIKVLFISTFRSTLCLPVIRETLYKRQWRKSEKSTTVIVLLKGWM